MHVHILHHINLPVNQTNTTTTAHLSQHSPLVVVVASLEPCDVAVVGVDEEPILFLTHARTEEFVVRYENSDHNEEEEDD